MDDTSTAARAEVALEILRGIEASTLDALGRGNRLKVLESRDLYTKLTTATRILARAVEDHG